MSSPEERELANRLREVREYLNFSQQFVSERTGMPRSAISDIERGERRVSTLELKRLANLYGYRSAYFLGDEEHGELDSAALAMARGASELCEEDQREVRRFIELLRNRTPRK
ncbi:MAG TPA: helix-turn-helix transcriptional regulator [Solirubrobacterales bacterium]|nr:helix-turn-helix transcriptional regulator [Solirubrobacterales bacterium]